MGALSVVGCLVLVQNDFFGAPEYHRPTVMPPQVLSGTNPWTISPLHFGHRNSSLVINSQCAFGQTDSHYKCPACLQQRVPAEQVIIQAWISTHFGVLSEQLPVADDNPLFIKAAPRPPRECRRQKAE